MSKLVPLHSLVIVVGPQPSDKISYLLDKSFLLDYFRDYEILDTDTIRYGLVGTDYRRDIEGEIFSEVHRRSEAKLKIGERVIIKTGLVTKETRISLAEIGVRAGVPVFYLICDNQSASDDERHKFQLMEKDILRGDGIAEVIDSRIAGLKPVHKMSNPLAEIKAKFAGITVIGDVHGMYQSLLASLDWARARHHYVIFLGDIVDYGSGTLDCADEVYRTVMRGNGSMVRGNHERKIAKWIDLPERNRYMMKLSEGNKVTTQALENLGNFKRDCWMSRFRGLVSSSPTSLTLDNYVFTHAAIHPEWWQGSKDFKSMENFSLFGEFEPSPVPFSEGQRPHRTYNWVNAIPAGNTVLVGHDARSFVSPVVNTNQEGGRAVFLDTGAGKGGYLSSVDIRFTPEGLKMENFTRH